MLIKVNLFNPYINRVKSPLSTLNKFSILFDKQTYHVGTTTTLNRYN